VKSEGRNQADHRPRDGAGGNRQIVMLSGAGPPWKAISSRANLLQSTRLYQSGQCASVNALTSYVAGTQDGLLLGQTEKSADRSPSVSRRFAYTHR
jgi:hypothetical protein